MRGKKSLPVIASPILTGYMDGVTYSLRSLAVTLPLYQAPAKRTTITISNVTR